MDFRPMFLGYLRDTLLPSVRSHPKPYGLLRSYHVPQNEMAAAPPESGYIFGMKNTPATSQNPNARPASEHDHFRQMRETLSQWADFHDTEWEMLRALFRPRRIGKSEYALKPGEKPSEILFIHSGLLRYFYAGGKSPDGEDGKDGKDSNKVFLTEGMFSSPIAGCPLSMDALCGIQALEPTVALVADAAAFNSLYDRHPIFDRLGRKLGEWWLGHKEARARAFQTQDARERYLSFTRLHGDLAQRIPQYHIASYLGITEVSLSRIRRSLARKPSHGAVAGR